MEGRGVQKGAGELSQGTRTVTSHPTHDSRTGDTCTHSRCTHARSHRRRIPPCVIVETFHTLDAAINGDGFLFTKPLPQPTSTCRGRQERRWRCIAAARSGDERREATAGHHGGRRGEVGFGNGNSGLDNDWRLFHRRYDSPTHLSPIVSSTPRRAVIAADSPARESACRTLTPLLDTRDDRGREGSLGGWRNGAAAWSSACHAKRDRVCRVLQDEPNPWATIDGKVTNANIVHLELTPASRSNVTLFFACHVDLATPRICNRRRRTTSGKPILRIGEASNPGPLHAGWRCADDVRFRDPSATGFWQACAPGYDGGGSQGEGRHAVRIVTANTTAWAPLQKLLLRSDADVILVQEHRLPPWRIAEASDWARRHRWHSIIIPARDTGVGGWSGGVAILARPPRSA